MEEGTNSAAGPNNAALSRKHVTSNDPLHVLDSTVQIATLLWPENV
jgi:hypothetical protein